MGGEQEGRAVASWVIPQLVGIHLEALLECPCRVRQGVVPVDQRVMVVVVDVDDRAQQLRVVVPWIPQWFAMLGELQQQVRAKVDVALRQSEEAQ